MSTLIPVLSVVGLNIEKATQDFLKGLMQEALQKSSVEAYIEIQADPKNPFDPNAIKVLVNGMKIGFIAKTDQHHFDFNQYVLYSGYIVSWGILKDSSVYFYIQPFLPPVATNRTAVGAIGGGG